MNTLRHLAQALGGDVAGAAVLCPGPGHSPRDRSLSVRPSATDPEGFEVYSHASDDWRDCRDHVRARLGIDRMYSRALRAPREHRAPQPADNTARAVALWNSAVEPRGTRVERYLQRRGLSLSDDIAGRVARYHETCPWGAEHRPAMLTAFRLITTDRLVAVHRTLISDDGLKIDRRMLGPVAGAAIKIDADENVEQGLTIGEGFETCLAARALGFRPIWALGAAAPIGVFPVLPGIEALTILGESDKNGTNKANALACGRRWLAAGQEAAIVFPNIDGDMNDLVKP
jgi:putative DNA primase/helicase